jgi:tRNA(fMet)-specific endonuclease VapC
MLDTDTVSLAVRNNPVVIKNLMEHEADEICINTITYAELMYGLEKRGSTRLSADVGSIIEKLTIVDFDTVSAEQYGKIRCFLEKSGTPLDNMDILIAASSMAEGAILVSHNVKHFSRIKGLKGEDWT